jgi:hypothetical protein
LMMLKRIHFNLSSHEKYQPVLSFVQIPEKHTRVSLHEGTSIVSSIMVKNSTVMVEEITSMA